MKHRLIASVLLAALVLPLAGCSSISWDAVVSFFAGTSHESVAAAEAEAADALKPQVSASALKEAGCLTVGIKTSGQLPMSSSDSDVYQGLDIDLAACIADRLGLKVRYVPIDDAASALADTCDIVMDMVAGEADGVTVVGSYAETGYAFFGKNVSGTVSADQISGKRIAVQMGSGAQAELGNAGIDVVLAYATTVNECFHMLEAGEADYAFCGAYQGAYLSRYIGKVSFAGSVGTISAIGIGVGSGSQELASAVQNALTGAEGDGTYDLIRAQWLGGMAHLSAATEVLGLADASQDASAQDGAQAA